jgi:hypothetical protein
MRTATFLILPLAASSLLAGEYSSDDREALIGHLEESRRGLAISLENVSHKQSQFSPGSNRWTILQVSEHLALAEEYFFGILQKALANSQPIPDSEKLPDPSEKDRGILKMISDRTHKAKAPEELVPQGKFANRDEAMVAFASAREKTTQFVRTTKLDLRRYKIDTPMGSMDAHQWILMMCAHTERHIKQIMEVTQHPEYSSVQ